MTLVQTLKARARELKRETHVLYLAVKDPRTPWYAKAVAGAVVAYALSPIDLIPDFIPVIGYLDDLIVVPLVGVDGRGLRLGMGGGFYDRALAFRRVRKSWKGPRLVGLAFDCQRVDTVFADGWDVRLDSLATESGLVHFHEG